MAQKLLYAPQVFRRTEQMGCKTVPEQMGVSVLRNTAVSSPLLNQPD